jgi:hypothetical protein
MISTGTVRVYVNGSGVDAPANGTALDAVRLWNADAAAEVERGTRALTDSRGLPTPPDTPVHGGAIFRLVSARQRNEE